MSNTGWDEMGQRVVDLINAVFRKHGYKSGAASSELDNEIKSFLDRLTEVEKAGGDTSVFRAEADAIMEKFIKELEVELAKPAPPTINPGKAQARRLWGPGAQILWGDDDE